MSMLGRGTAYMQMTVRAIHRGVRLGVTDMIMCQAS